MGRVTVLDSDPGGIALVLSRMATICALGFLQVTLAIGEKVPWTGGFTVVR